MNRRNFFQTTLSGAAALSVSQLLQLSCGQPDSKYPNIVIIYADDLGYGDVSCYGATAVETPNIDRIAKEGIRFTQAYATAATCTPSRYSLLTGEYAWRREDTGIARGDATLIIKPGTNTLPAMLGQAGYKSGVVGKWHLGLGEGKPDWNGELKPGPLEIGFDYCFLIPATGDRVPCVYVENHGVVGRDPEDPIQVSFEEPVGDEPTGMSHPERLKVGADPQHSETIVNGISRIGTMEGGLAARWVDEDMADVISGKAVQFIQDNKDNPFFLFFSLHDIHVPRVPHDRFRGKTDMGARGDAIVQADWCVGEVMRALDEMGITDNTLLLFTSDNGPVLNDGYMDEAVERVGDHKTAGPLRGGKYSSFEAGTRVPFLIRWPNRFKPGESDALVSQVDLTASFAALTGQSIPGGQSKDSLNKLSVLTGESETGRPYIVEEAMGRKLSIRKGNWKYIVPAPGPKIMANKNIETGRSDDPQLFDLLEDIGETKNLAGEKPDVVEKMEKLIVQIQKNGDRYLQ